MRTVNIHHAKTHLSRLVEDAAGGEEIVIAKHNRPVARLVALEASARPRVPGGWEGTDLDGRRLRRAAPERAGERVL